MLKTTTSKVLLFLLFGFFAFYTPLLAESPIQPQKGPFAAFFALHMEVGSWAPDYEHQERYWPDLVKEIAIADKYDVKMTLLFNPQWAEYILMDPEKYRLLKAWQQNGHEVGLHYHLVTHRDWCGFTNRKDPVYVESPKYRGTVENMMVLVQQLADPKPVVTACNGPDILTQVPPFTHPVPPGFVDEIDFPDQIVYDVDGIHDGRIRPVPFDLNGKTRYHLRHGVAISKENIEQRMEEIASAEADEIVGLVTHAADLDPILIEELFQFIGEKNIPVRSVSQVMQQYLNTPHSCIKKMAEW